MTTLTFNESAIFSLHKLAKEVYWKTGLRCRLSNRINLLRLLKFASHCKQSCIRGWYLSFLKQLSIDQLKLLKKYGVLLPRKLYHLINDAQKKTTFTSVCSDIVKPLFAFIKR